MFAPPPAALRATAASMLAVQPQLEPFLPSADDPTDPEVALWPWLDSLAESKSGLGRTMLDDVGCGTAGASRCGTAVASAVAA